MVVKAANRKMPYLAYAAAIRFRFVTFRSG
jgi:hypothetical protein